MIKPLDGVRSLPFGAIEVHIGGVCQERHSGRIWTAKFHEPGAALIVPWPPKVKKDA